MGNPISFSTANLIQQRIPEVSSLLYRTGIVVNVAIDYGMNGIYFIVNDVAYLTHTLTCGKFILHNNCTTYHCVEMTCVVYVLCLYGICCICLLVSSGDCRIDLRGVLVQQCSQVRK